MSRKVKKIISVFLIVGVAATSWVFGNSDKRSIEDIYYNQYREPIVRMLAYINQYYYGKDDVDYSKILDSLLKGMVDGIGDPFAWYFDARQTTENHIDETGKYGGLGITVRYDSPTKSIVIVSPMYGTPAEKAGLMANDYIISVDGSPVSETGYMKAIDRMRGKPGTPVKIKVIREGWKKAKEIEIVRALIETKTVKYTTFEKDSEKIGYIRLTNFGDKSDVEMNNALKDLSTKNINGLILDLRNNPGGLLHIAINIASMYIKNDVIVYLKYSDGSEETTTPIPGKYFDFLNGLPITVLVNKGSASASEILTGALKDNKIATIIGGTTYGKAAVQRPFTFPNGGEAWIPIGHYFTPNKIDIHLKGIEPNIKIDNPVKEVKSSIDIEKEKNEALNQTTNKVYLNFKNDLQLNKAIEVILEKLGEKVN
ncbi:peptidase S41 [Tepiditoga spiralis]|uniref:Peptidase S41 n=1 Tax=Tepiditoga spiralis TaxID=2108365 RepID=A0A7G1G6Q9_9BACT|nr:S41 family peptidase [Tepiditoga spiralis]BBE30587.1 peptidase S41 [Tepiditoga spiralis]